jgi:hypothetical protein
LTTGVAAVPPLVSVRAQPGALPLGAVLGTIGGLAVLAVGLLGLDRLPITLCYFKTLSGWPCLTCGATRACARLFVLDLPGALACNPLFTLVALGVGAWAVADFALWPRGRALAIELSAGPARAARILVFTALALNWLYLVVAGR